MAKRALKEGDIVCIRPECVASVSHEEDTDARPHVPCSIVERIHIGRRTTYKLHVIWGPPIYVWPSQVRLADGAEERLWKREQKAIAEIEEMKEKRRAAKKGRKAS